MRSLPAVLTLSLTAVTFPHSGQAQSRAHDPNATQSSRMEIVIAATAQGASSHRGSRVIAFLPDCRRLIDLDAADSAAIAAVTPPSSAVPTESRESAVVFSLLHLASSRPECYVVSVAVRRGERVLPPLLAQRERLDGTTSGSRSGGASGTTTERRVAVAGVAIDPADLAPGPDGVVDDLILEVHVAAGGAPKAIAIPWADVRMAWLPVLDLGELPAAPADRRAALATAGLARLAARDTTAARILLGQLVADEPCLRLASTVDAAAREFTAALHRPEMRCTAQSRRTTLLRAALLPGFGRPVDANARARRAGIATAVGVSTVGTIYMWGRARAARKDYLYLADLDSPDVDVGNLVGKLRAREVRSRTLSHLFLTVAAATWGTQLVTTVTAEQRHAERLAAVCAFDPAARPRNVSWTPILGPSALGLSVALRF